MKFKNAVIRNSATNSSGTPSTISGTGAEGIEIPADQAVDLVTQEQMKDWHMDLFIRRECGTRETISGIICSCIQLCRDNYVSTFTWSLTDAPTEGKA